MTVKQTIWKLVSLFNFRPRHWFDLFSTLWACIRRHIILPSVIIDGFHQIKIESEILRKIILDTVLERLVLVTGNSLLKNVVFLGAPHYCTIFYGKPTKMISILSLEKWREWSWWPISWKRNLIRKNLNTAIDFSVKSTLRITSLAFYEIFFCWVVRWMCSMLKNAYSSHLIEFFLYLANCSCKMTSALLSKCLSDIL